MDINLYSPAGLRRLLGEESAAPLKKFGQNFLINPAVVERMIAESGLTGADGVLEIGPGPGALTSRLVPRRLAPAARSCSASAKEEMPPAALIFLPAAIWAADA